MGKVLLVQGWFHQQGYVDTIEYDPATSGCAVSVHQGFTRHCFSGEFTLDPDNEGICLDEFGPSKLSNIVLRPERFSFDKAYKNERPHQHTIHYSFTRDPRDLLRDIWSGNYYSDMGKGCIARCVITQVDETVYFAPEN